MFADAPALARKAEDRGLEALVIAATALTVSESPMAGFDDRSAYLKALQAPPHSTAICRQPIRLT